MKMMSELQDIDRGDTTMRVTDTGPGDMMRMTDEATIIGYTDHSADPARHRHPEIHLQITIDQDAPHLPINVDGHTLHICATVHGTARAVGPEKIPHTPEKKIGIIREGYPHHRLVAGPILPLHQAKLDLLQLHLPR